MKFCFTFLPISKSSKADDIFGVFFLGDDFCIGFGDTGKVFLGGEGERRD
jgi:hypothetical protein